MIRRPPRSTLFPYTDALPIWDDTRFTVLFVTHSIEEAIIVGSRILVLSPHPGQVKAELNAHQYGHEHQDRKSTRLNSSHANISYAVFCLKKKEKPQAHHARAQ